MHRAITQFDQNIARISKIDALYSHLTDHLKLTVDDVGDILRSQIVYGVSAFDKLIHELVKIGMIEIFMRRRPNTPGYLRFQINLALYDDLLTPGYQPPELVFEKAIVDTHSYIAFQDPGKVSEGLNLIWSEPHKWQTIGRTLGIAADDVKTKLRNIVIRRNQIVHESDLDLSTDLPQAISQSDAIDSISFLRDLGHCIYNLVI